MSVIRFGTDGWRARMGRDFTFNNVRIFAQAYANHLKKTNAGKDLKVLVNYDTRFLSKQFAIETAKLFSLHGIGTLLPSRDAPLPAVSLSAIKNRCIGAINFTASFNKPIYNGIKVFNQRGAPAMPSLTALLEGEIDKTADHFQFKPRYADNRMIETIDVSLPYIKYIESLVDFDLIRESGLAIVVDNLYGASRGYLDYLLEKNGIEIESIHNFPYSSVGAVVPSCDSENLQDLSTLVIERGADLGLATDIDGDRFGILDNRGRFVCANQIVPPLIEYLITVRKMEGGIVKSISTTDTVRHVADYYLRRVYVTPVGFKYLADMLCRRKTFIAVESTNGASLNQGITIKDGILFNLLVAEMLAHYRLDLIQVLHNFYLKFPKLYSREVSIRRTPRVADKLARLLTRKRFTFEGRKLREVNQIDGIKFIFEDGWLLLRESGTSDVVRVYAESPMQKMSRELISRGRELLE